MSESLKRLFTRRKSIRKPAREDISSSVTVLDPVYLTAIREENGHDANENPQEVSSAYDSSSSEQAEASGRLQHVKLPYSHTLSPPLRSAPTSTPGPAKTMRSRASLHALSPPPYSSLDDFEELGSPSHSTYRASGEAVPSTSTRAVEHADSNHKGKKKRRGDEEEVEDRAELPRMIAYLTATENEDWALVLELCERASSSEANAKEAVKALRWEFKYAEPAAQFSAAQLWAIMFRNSSKTLLEQIMSHKFLDALEDVLTSPRTPTIVKERLMEVLGAVTYACGNDIHDARTATGGFCELWCRLKSPDDPEEGIPFDMDDEILNPSTPRATSPDSEDLDNDDQPSPILERRRSIPQRQRSFRIPQRQGSVRSRNSSSTSDEEMRRIFQECKIGQGNANLLLEGQLLRFSTTHCCSHSESKC
ncbi:hypothetical protein PILCRDRAFT_470719 [Piloderma croceum F 1598]|uniref:VHS domain-containing protein n=1 Tax=Piloderma croceum (strain F 1598) TaxID=765440 RepID=A0A0C3FC42_PILCF|nr:hypothetical protein PILCRDRAFT_470719 [Piloderma croceum F 1598]